MKVDDAEQEAPKAPQKKESKTSFDMHNFNNMHKDKFKSHIIPSNHILQEYFEEIWDIKGKQLKMCMLTLPKLKRILEQRYKANAVEAILDSLKIEQNLRYIDYCEKLNEFLNQSLFNKMYLWYRIFDVDQDGRVSLRDVIEYINNLHFTDIYLKNDALKISKYLNNKILK